MNIYVVQNKEGKYFRNVGRDGGGKSWRDKLEDAKFYTKLGQAKSRVTFWYKHAPEFGCPRILSFALNDSNVTVIDMETETKKSITKAEKAVLARQVKYLEYEREKGWKTKAELEVKMAEINKKLAALGK